jgi:hypothetical protein
MAVPRLRRWHLDRNYFDANDAILILWRYFGSLNVSCACCALHSTVGIRRKYAPSNRISPQRRFPLSGQEAVAFDQLGEGEATGNSGGHYDRGRDVLSPVMRFFESTSLRFRSSDFTRSSPLTDSDSVTFSTCSNASLLASFSFTHKIIAGRR